MIRTQLHFLPLMRLFWTAYGQKPHPIIRLTFRFPLKPSSEAQKYALHEKWSEFQDVNKASHTEAHNIVVHPQSYNLYWVWVKSERVNGLFTATVLAIYRPTSIKLSTKSEKDWFVGQLFRANLFHQWGKGSTTNQISKQKFSFRSRVEHTSHVTHTYKSISSIVQFGPAHTRTNGRRCAFVYQNLNEYRPKKCSELNDGT